MIFAQSGISCNFPLRAAHANLQFASAIQFRLKKQTSKCPHQCSSGRRTWEYTGCMGDKVLGTSYYKALDSTIQKVQNALLRATFLFVHLQAEM